MYTNPITGDLEGSFKNEAEKEEHELANAVPCQNCGCRFQPEELTFHKASSLSLCFECLEQFEENAEPLDLKVNHEYVTTSGNASHDWSCTLKDWDLGVPIGHGSTIQEAIENFLVWWECENDVEMSKIKYVWS